MMGGRYRGKKVSNGKKRQLQWTGLISFDPGG